MLAETCAVRPDQALLRQQPPAVLVGETVGVDPPPPIDGGQQVVAHDQPDSAQRTQELEGHRWPCRHPGDAAAPWRGMYAVRASGTP